MTRPPHPCGRAATTPCPAGRPIQPRRLADGELQSAVLAHLRKHPGLDFTPVELAHVLSDLLQRRVYHGPVINACQRLCQHGAAVRTQPRPQRYRAASTGQPPT